MLYRRNILRRTLAMLMAGAYLALGGFSTNHAAPAEVAKTAGTAEVGVASYYADKYHGKTTASGETFDMNALTAAHRTLPFGTLVRVTQLENNRSVVVRINDRGPFIEGRVIDLSRAAAEQLQITRAGLAKVKVEIVPAPAS